MAPLHFWQRNQALCSRAYCPAAPARWAAAVRRLAERPAVPGLQASCGPPKHPAPVPAWELAQPSYVPHTPAKRVRVCPAEKTVCPPAAALPPEVPHTRCPPHLHFRLSTRSVIGMRTRAAARINGLLRRPCPSAAHHHAQSPCRRLGGACRGWDWYSAAARQHRPLLPQLGNGSRTVHQPPSPTPAPPPHRGAGGSWAQRARHTSLSRNAVKAKGSGRRSKVPTLPGIHSQPDSARPGAPESQRVHRGYRRCRTPLMGAPHPPVCPQRAPLYYNVLRQFARLRTLLAAALV